MIIILLVWFHTSLNLFKRQIFVLRRLFGPLLIFHVSSLIHAKISLAYLNRPVQAKIHVAVDQEIDVFLVADLFFSLLYKREDLINNGRYSERCQIYAIKPTIFSVSYNFLVHIARTCHDHWFQILRKYLVTFMDRRLIMVHWLVVKEFYIII